MDVRAAKIEIAKNLEWFYSPKNKNISAFEKLRKAIEILKRTFIDFRESSDYQDIRALLELRNALVHYKSEWFDEQDNHAELSELLENKAVRSPFFTSPQLLKEPLFPRAWASHGTTVWAVKTVRDTVLQFEKSADIKTGYSSRFSSPQLKEFYDSLS